jgi:predicted RNase H-like HicB family nuclease
MQWPRVAAMRKGRYRVVFERDDGRAWIAHVPSVRGCHTYGRTINQARKRVREALALWVDDAETAELVEDVRLPPRALEAVRRSRNARRRATEQREKAHETTAEAARTLVEDLDLGLRDAADLLGLSHQRVQQLVRS